MGEVSMAIAVVVDTNQQELQQTINQLKGSDAFTEIIPFEDSLEAVKYIELHGCDVVFTEVEMDGVSGFDFIRRFRSRRPAICFVFVTNKGNYALSAFEYDAADFIIKPIDAKSIRRVMKKMQNNGIRIL